MAEFKVSVTLPSVMNARPEIADKLFPLLSQAVNVIAQATLINWRNSVDQAKLWIVEKDRYRESIKMKPTGKFSALVWSDYKYAEEIETGRPPRDLKKMLDTSKKVRRTKDGRRFLVIPLRYNTPGNDATGPAMPMSVYEIASKMKETFVTGQRQAPSGEVTALSPMGMRPLKKQTPFLSNTATKSPMMVQHNTYKWGEKIPGIALGSSADERKYGNMYRFKESTGGSIYLTFRVMMEGSPGWIVPAKPGLYLAKKVADDMQPIAEMAFGEAVKTIG